MLKIAAIVLLGLWLYLRFETRFRRSRDVQWPPWQGR